MNRHFRPLFFLFLCFGVPFLFSSLPETSSPEEVFQKMVEKDETIQKALQSWQYQQSVKNWIEKKPGEMIDLEEIQMKVRPRSESSFMILNPKEEWIHGGSPEDELARKGRNIQRNLEIASLKTLRECFDFQGVGKEKKREIEAYRFHLRSKPDFKPKTKIEKVMKEVEADLWVDLNDFSVIGVEATLLKPISVAWLFATIQELRFDYQTTLLPVGRVMSGFDLDLKLSGMSGKSTRHRRVRMSDYQANPGQDLW